MKEISKGAIIITFLLYFVLGIIFVEFIQPVLEELTAVIIGKFETIKAKYSIEITQSNKTIQDITESMEEVPQQPAIGFLIDSEEEDCDE